MQEIKLKIPGKYTRARCLICKAEPAEEKFCDLTEFNLDHLQIVLCHDCALSLVRLLLGRFYALWGSGPVLEFFSQEIEIEREACAKLVEEHFFDISGQYKDIAAAIRARGEGE